jgi:hypothetical protein
MFSPLYASAVTLIAGNPSALVHDIRYISQLFGMVCRVLGLEVCSICLPIAFDWQYISALRFSSALIFPASRYERLIS